MPERALRPGLRETLDEMVEVTFTSIRAFGASRLTGPHDLPAVEYLRQMYWGSAIDIPEEGFETMLEEMVIESAELPPAEKIVLSIQLPAMFVIVFEPVTHYGAVHRREGDPTRERRSLSLVYDNDHSHNATLEC